MGKRGGARVIYYFHSERLPAFLLSVYAKNHKANLSMAERNAMKRLVPALVAGVHEKGISDDKKKDIQPGSEEGDPCT